MNTENMLISNYSSKSNKDNAEFLIFKCENEIHFMADITYQSMHVLIKHLKEYEKATLAYIESCKKSFTIKDNKKHIVSLNIEARPILLYVTTYGGSIYAALKTVDIIENLQVPVYTVASGYVASAGTLLTLAGKKKYITPHTFMMIHELRSGFWGKYSDAREEIVNLDKLMKLVIDFTKSRSKLTDEELKETLTRDRNWDVDECIVKGMVDEILPRLIP
jgi:ATP-dependent protease ClpP protease subunit